MATLGQHLRVDGYVRVSDVAGRRGVSFISPSLQRDRIEAWCGLYDARLLSVFEELDESGGRADRPLLMRALARIESGQSQGLVVARLDRFGRSLRDALDHIARIERAGGTFISVEDRFDLGSDHGRLVLRLMLSFAEFERDRYRTTWQDAQRKAIARGVHTASVAPVGYRKGPDGRLRIDGRAAPAVREAFHLRARGATIEQVAGYLREHRVGWSKGATVWSRGSVETLIANRVYLGEAHNGPYRCPGAHRALVDETTWRLAQYQPSRTYGTRYPGLLYGVLRCAGCRSLMKITSSGSQRVYGCSRIAPQRGPCPTPIRIEQTAMDALAEDLVFAAARRRPQVTRKARAASLTAEQELSKAEERLARFRDSDRVIDALDDEQYGAGLRSRMDDVHAAADDLRDRRQALITHTQELLRGIQRRWPAMTIQVRRDAVRAVIEVMFVRGTRADAIDQRVWICEPGEGPTRLPWPRHQLPPKAYDFPVAAYKQRRQHRRLLAARRYGWSEDEIKAGLRDLIAGREVFPTPAEFRAADQRRLYDHVTLRGGGPYWAARLGVRFDQGQRTACLLWTEERIRKQLDEFLHGRSRWPTVEEFRTAGHAELRRALVRFGGVEQWAEKYNLPLARRRGSAPGWSEDAIEAALREFLGDRYDWPRKREFAAAGLGGCHEAIWRGAGVDAWATRMGVTKVASRGGRRPTRAVMQSERATRRSPRSVK